MNILVVDDDQLAREALQDLFSFEGFAVRGARSLEEALAAVEAETFDLIVTDSLADSYRGAPLVAVDRLVEAASGSPVMLATAHHDVATLDLDEHGLAALILKPFGVSELLDCVRALIEQR